MLCGIYLPILRGARSLITNSYVHSGPYFVADPLAGGPITLPLEKLGSLSWSQLTLPVIDPFQGFGIPLLANQGVPVYFPQLIAHFLFPNNYSIWIVLNLILLAFGSYLLASSFRQNFPGAIAVGVAATLAGVAPPNLNMGMLNPFAILPFVLLSVRYSVDPESPFHRIGLLGTATSVALLSLSGFQEVLPLLAFVIIVYTIAAILHFHTFQRRRGLILWTAGSGVVGMVIGSIGLIPVLTAVRSGAGFNSPDSYVGHVPSFWLSTLTIPSLTQRAMVDSPQDLGQTVFTLGSPLLILVIALSIALVVRPAGKGVRWYVWPSVVLVIFGILGYADVLHVLQIFDLPLINSIVTIRFLQFAWWLPWCLLLGAVITNVRHLRWYDAAVSLALTAAYDWYFVLRFRGQLVDDHLARFFSETNHAVILAIAIAIAFAAGILVVRWTTPRVASLLMTSLVVASCLCYLPTNFFPASAGSAVSALRIPGIQSRRGTYLAFFGTAQLPTAYYSVQLWGPIVPKAYSDTMSALFSSSETHGYGALYHAVPSLGFAKLTPRFLDVLRSLGADQVVTGVPLLSHSIFGEINPCGTPDAVVETSTLCFLGRSMNIGVPSDAKGYAYEILGASPLVDTNPLLVAVSSTTVGLNEFLKGVSPLDTAIPRATPTSHPRVARYELLAMSWEYREARQPSQFPIQFIVDRPVWWYFGQHIFKVSARQLMGGGTAVFPVDGGLWTAVDIGSGNSRVVLSYETAADRVELGIAAVGMVVLFAAGAWLFLASIGSARRRRSLENEPTIGSGSTGIPAIRPYQLASDVRSGFPTPAAAQVDDLADRPPVIR